MVRKTYRCADEDRRHLRAEFLIDLIDDRFAQSRRKPHAAVGRNRHHDGIGHGPPLIIGHRRGDLGVLRVGVERQHNHNPGEQHAQRRTLHEIL